MHSITPIPHCLMKNKTKSTTTRRKPTKPTGQGPLLAD